MKVIQALTVLCYCSLAAVLLVAAGPSARVTLCGTQPPSESAVTTTKAPPLDGHQEQQPASLVRRQFGLLALFTFEQFKGMFNKHYSSLLEEIVRRKIFLGRTFRAFISQVKYRHFNASSYQGINEMSDETPQERERLRLSAHELGVKLRLQQQHRPAESAQTKPDDDEVAIPAPLADLSDIEREIDEIEAHKDEPGYKEIAQDLEGNLELANPSSSVAMRRGAIFVQRGGQAAASSSSSSSNLAELETLTHLNGTVYVDKVVKAAVKVAKGSVGKGKGAANKDSSPLTSQVTPIVADEDDHSTIHVDHRNSSCLNPVRNQYRCGSCYTFSSIALYEFLYCKAYGKRISFSEQYMLDCGFRKELLACDGGFPSNAVEFIDSFGLELRKDYPYKKQAGSCPYEEDTQSREMGFIKPHKSGWHYIEKLEDIDSYLRKRPILFTLSLTSTFRDYAGGIDDGLDCDDDRAHAMLLIGCGEENGQQYYLFRNSHGPQWGEKGYYRFSRDTLDKCAPNDYGVFSTAQFIPEISGQNSHYTLNKSKLNEKEDKETDLIIPVEKPRTRSKTRLP